MRFIIFCFLITSVGLAQKTEKPDDVDPLDGEVEDFQSARSQAALNYRKRKEGIRQQFRADFSTAIAFAESIEIFLLDFEMVKALPENGVALSTDLVEGIKYSEDGFDLEKDEVDRSPPGFFRIKPYASYSRILKRRRLTGALVEECRDDVVALLKSPKDGGGAWCHYPIHGIRMATKEGEVIFQTSICYFCGNYYFSYPDSENLEDEVQVSEWVGFHGDKLEAFLKREMPIPQAEMDRFKAKFKK